MTDRFALQLAQFAEKTKGKANTLVRGTLAYVVEQVDLNSPVGDPKRWKHPESAPEGYVGGRFRANWQLGVGVLPQAILDKIDNDGRETVDAAIAKIPTDAAGEVYFYANSLPYAQALEYGHSSQAPGPGGIVGLTMIGARQFVIEEAGRLGRE